MIVLCAAVFLALPGCGKDCDDCNLPTTPTTPATPTPTPTPTPGGPTSASLAYNMCEGSPNGEGGPTAPCAPFREIAKDSDGGFTISRNKDHKLYAWVTHPGRNGCRIEGSIVSNIAQTVIPMDYYERLGGTISPSPLRVGGYGFHSPVTAGDSYRLIVKAKDSCDSPAAMDRTIPVRVR